MAQKAGIYINSYSDRLLCSKWCQLNAEPGTYRYDIFINCNWVVTRWQYTFTHKQYIEQHK